MMQSTTRLVICVQLLLLISVSFRSEAQNDSVQPGLKYHKLDTLIVKGDRLNQRNTVSEIVIDKKTIEANQGLLQDPVRVISLMPGVSRGGDLFSPSHIYIRGGAPEENLFMSNNAKLYFPYYFGGQKSIFNSDITDNIELLTGGFPARYGNALSSVLNVTTRDGNRERLRGNLSFGFYNAGLTGEGPMGKHASFIVSVRRTYLDLFLKQDASFPVANFGDITYKFSLYASKRHKLSLSGLSGYQDMNFISSDPRPGVAERLKTQGHMHNQSLQWQYADDRLYSKLSLTNTMQRTATAVGKNLDLDIRGAETGIREDLEYAWTPSVKLQAGAEAYHNSVRSNSTLPRDPREVDPNDTNIRLSKIAYNSTYWLIGSWLSAKLKYRKDLGLDLGFRHDLHSETNQQTISPRLSGFHGISTRTELRVSYTHHYQFPSPQAFMVNSQIEAARAIHYIAGINHKLSPKIAGWLEVYHKEYDHLSTFDTSLNYSDKGSGYARGIELFIRKESEVLSGWFSYAYSLARRRSNLDQEEYFFDYDQRHIVNLTLQYQIARPQTRWYVPVLLSCQVRAESGKPYTPVLNASQISTGWILHKGEINSLREPTYFNANLHIEWIVRKTDRVRVSSFVEIWNVTNHRNILGRTVEYGNQYPNNVHTTEYYTTPFLPAGGVKVEYN